MQFSHGWLLRCNQILVLAAAFWLECSISTKSGYFHGMINSRFRRLPSSAWTLKFSLLDVGLGVGSINYDRRADICVRADNFRDQRSSPRCWTFRDSTCSPRWPCDRRCTCTLPMRRRYSLPNRLRYQHPDAIITNDLVPAAAAHITHSQPAVRSLAGAKLWHSRRWLPSPNSSTSCLSNQTKPSKDLTLLANDEASQSGK